uniref:Uncharacterized protein n=1 Tax=Rhizophora mucronata TaxID=61149 RepID=A0A2P2JGT6_RHIMU
MQEKSFQGTSSFLVVMFNPHWICYENHCALVKSRLNMPKGCLIITITNARGNQTVFQRHCPIIVVQCLNANFSNPAHTNHEKSRS